MRKKLLSLAIAVASGALCSLSAQTDVTATYLTNTGFDDSPITFLAGGQGLNSSAVRIGTTGWVYTIPGWTNSSVVLANAVQVASAEYGASSSSSGLNGTTPPLSDPSSNSTGASLHMSAGWGDKALLTQAATLPAGKYRLIYNVYNANTVTTIYANYCGFAPTSGTAVYSSTKTFALSAWVKDTATFTLANQTAGNISIGFTTSSGGSGSGAKLYIENVKLLYYGIDKTDLNAKISEAQTLVDGDTGSDADALNAVIAAAQVVAGNTNATQADINSAIANLDTAILNYKVANASDSDPLDLSPYFGTNLDFESNQGDRQQTIPGWTKTGSANSEFCTRNDAGTLGQYKHGSVYFQYWAQDLPDYQLSQTVTGLPNGKYWVIAGASNSSANNDGFYLFAGSNQTAITSVANDYQVDANVVDGTLTFGVKAVGSIVNGTGAEWTQADNFRLYYIGPLTDPALSVSTSSLNFNSTSLTKTFTVSAAYLTSDVTLQAPAGITLDKTSLTAADANAGVTTITATFDNTTNIVGESIIITSGSLSQTIVVTASADGGCFVSHQPTLTNLIPDPYLNDISGFGGWGHRSVVNGAEAYCGASAVKFAATTNGYPDGAALDVSSVAWQPGHTYKVYAKIKALDGTFVFFAKGTDPDAAITVPQSTTGDWESFEAEFTTGAAAATNFFSFNNVDNGSTGKMAYIDNWELYDMGLTTSIAPKLGKAFQVLSGKGELTIQSEDAKTVNIYSITGQLVKKVTVSGSKTIALPQGFYVVNGVKSFVK